jgi:hypothetical protein
MVGAKRGCLDAMATSLNNSLFVESPAKARFLKVGLQ